MLLTPDGTDAMVIPVETGGRFEANGLPADSMRVSAAVPGYRLSPKNPGFDPVNGVWTTVDVRPEGAELQLILERGGPQPRGLKQN